MNENNEIKLVIENVDLKIKKNIVHWMITRLMALGTNDIDG